MNVVLGPSPTAAGSAGMISSITRRRSAVGNSRRLGDRIARGGECFGYLRARRRLASVQASERRFATREDSPVHALDDLDAERQGHVLRQLRRLLAPEKFLDGPRVGVILDWDDQREVLRQIVQASRHVSLLAAGLLEIGDPLLGGLLERHDFFGLQMGDIGERGHQSFQVDAHYIDMCHGDGLRVHKWCNRLGAASGSNRSSAAVTGRASASGSSKVASLCMDGLP